MTFKKQHLDWSVHRAARKEFFQDVLYYKVHGFETTTAEKFVEDIITAEQRLMNDPELCPEDIGGCRSILTHIFKYRIFYKIDEPKGKGQIMAYAPPKRKPGYWTRRKPS